MDMFDLASTLFGRNGSMSRQSTLTATGSAASADGTAYLVVDADVTPAEGVGDDEDQTVIDVPTSPDVAEGDEVVMMLVGDGPLKTPIVMANPGSGDRMAVSVSNAETLAQQAEAVANATGQHFWERNDGAHVTHATRDEWEAAEADPEADPAGPNSLWNSLGMLFRDGLTNLMAVLPQNELVEAFVCPDVSAVTFVQFTTSERPRSIVSVTVDGEVPSYPWHMNKRGVYFSGNASFMPHGGQEVIVTYISVSSLTIFDGLGNFASNVTAKFSDAFVSLAKGVFQLEVGDVSYGSQTVSMALSPDDEQHAEIRLTKDINNDRAYIALQADNSTSFAAIIVDTGGAFTGRVADFAYVDTLHFTESTFIPIAQANVGLAQPEATFTGTNSTATASSSGWQLTYFNTLVGGTSSYSDYFTNSNGVITVLKSCVLEISGVMNWTDTIAGMRGFGLFYGSTVVSSGTEHSAFTSFPSGGSTRRSVMFPPKCIPCTAGVKIAIGRYQQQNAVYQNGTNFSWMTIRVVEDRSV